MVFEKDTHYCKVYKDGVFYTSSNGSESSSDWTNNSNFGGNVYPSGTHMEDIVDGLKTISTLGYADIDTTHVNNTGVINQYANMSIKYFRIWNNHSLNQTDITSLYNDRENQFLYTDYDPEPEPEP